MSTVRKCDSYVGDRCLMPRRGALRRSIRRWPAKPDLAKVRTRVAAAKEQAKDGSAATPKAAFDSGWSKGLR
jgi:hypothetical protein